MRVLLLLCLVSGAAASLESLQGMRDRVAESAQDRETLKGVHRSLARQQLARKLLEEHADNVPRMTREKAERAVGKHAAVLESIVNRLDSADASKIRAYLDDLRLHERHALRSFHRMGGHAAAARMLQARKHHAEDRNRSKLRATAADLERATGIDMRSEDIWAAPFQVVDELFDGQPPAEAVGVSAKFYASGRVVADRYHVALQPPCDCWALDRDSVSAAARHLAETLQAPRLVGTWIDVLMADASRPLPALGFGVSRSDNAAKLYVMNHSGRQLPPLPLHSGDDVLATVDDLLPRGEGSVMVSLEWQLGRSAVQLRQYAVHEGATERERLSAGAGDDAIGEALAPILSIFEAATEDVIVTEPFEPEQMAVALRAAKAPLHELVAPSRPRSKAGLKLRRGASHADEARFLTALRPAFALANVKEEYVRAWMAASSGVPHAMNNLQLGKGFLTLYRHPSTFGHVDVEIPAHRQALIRSLRLIERNPEVTPYTRCEEAQGEFEDAVVWGTSESLCSCSAGQLGETACPLSCQDEIEKLVERCDSCADVWQVCDEDIDDGSYLDGDYVLYEITFEALVSITREDGEPITTDSLEESHCDSVFLEGILEQFHDSGEDEVRASINYDSVTVSNGIIGFNYTVQASGIELEVDNSADWLEVVKFHVREVYDNDNFPRQGDLHEEHTCDLVDESVDLLDDKDVSDVSSAGSTWEDVPFEQVPASKKWKAPYGGAGLIEDMNLWGPVGCRYPFYSYFPSRPLCTTCASVAETLEGANVWGGPCVHDIADEDWGDAPRPEMSSGCSCDCYKLADDVDTFCRPGDALKSCANVENDVDCGGDKCSGNDAFNASAPFEVITPIPDACSDTNSCFNPLNIDPDPEGEVAEECASEARESEFCSQAFCTSPDTTGGYDCWAGSDAEPCTCSQGEARMIDYPENHVEYFGKVYYEYTCCWRDDGSNTGEMCGNYKGEENTAALGFLFLLCICCCCCCCCGYAYNQQQVKNRQIQQQEQQRQALAQANSLQRAGNAQVIGVQPAASAYPVTQAKVVQPAAPATGVKASAITYPASAAAAQAPQPAAPAYSAYGPPANAPGAGAAPPPAYAGYGPPGAGASDQQAAYPAYDLSNLSGRRNG